MGLAAFACVLLVVLFIMINKYGRRSKFGMKGKVEFSRTRVSWEILIKGAFQSPFAPREGQGFRVPGTSPGLASPLFLLMMALRHSWCLWDKTMGFYCEY